MLPSTTKPPVQHVNDSTQDFAALTMSTGNEVFTLKYKFLPVLLQMEVVSSEWEG